MKRRKFILGAGSAAIGGSALIGSGAFSRVESQRSVTIEVAEDPDAYLGLDGCPESPNQSYTNIDDNGHLEIDMTPTNATDAGGEGVNSNSRTWFDSVFQLCNQGKEQVCVYIEDDEDWPVVGEDDSEEFAGDRRVDFYLEGEREESVIGMENAFHLSLGECVCIGLRTNTKGLSEDDRLLEDISETITIIADTDDFCKEVDPQCPELTGEYECTTYEEQNGEFQRTGTRFRISNDGDAPVDGGFDLAISNQPGSFDEFPNRELGPGDDFGPISDASVPVAGLVIWDVPDECVGQIEGLEEVVRWGDYKGGENQFDMEFEDLEDWYNSTGTANGPEDAPQDLDDDQFVSEIGEIPQEEEPDETIDEDLYPDMSEGAEDAGWITCEKEDQD